MLRQIERRPWRSGLSMAAVAASVAIVVMGNFFRDAIDMIVDTQFNRVLRSDVVLWLGEAAPQRARLELARLPGARQVEAQRNVAARLRFGPRSERVVLQGLAADAELLRIVDAEGRAHRIGGTGVVLTDRLADKLGVRVGETVLAETLEGERRVLALPVDARVGEMMGLNAYIDLDVLNRALGQDRLASQFALQVERGSEGDLLRASRALPRVVGAFSKTTLLRNMQEISARNVRLMSLVLTLFAIVIAVGVVYNNARVALAERAWELASLRVLGFSRAEVSVLLLGEMALQLLVALPLGMLLGRALIGVLALLMKSDQFLFPIVVQPATYALAALAVLGAAAASALVVRRRIDRLDLVAALKTRE
jgi:putative ABC transport system permease protein